MLDTLNNALIKAASLSDKGINFVSGESDSGFYSYKELFASAKDVSSQLKQLGVRRGGEVILQLDNNHEFLTVFWACLLGGYIPVPLAVGNNEEHLIKTLRIAGMLNHPVVVSNDKHFEKLDEIASRQNYAAVHRISVVALLEPWKGVVTDLTPVQPQDIAFIQFSSGTTGDPKGVILTHSNLLANIEDLRERLGAAPEDTFLSWMPLTHDLGMIMFHLLPLLSGASQHLMPTWLFIRRPMLWMHKADQVEATIMASPNFGLKYFINAYKKASAQTDISWNLSAIRAIVNGAEPIDVEVSRSFLDELSRFGLKPSAMKMGYGMAEACVGVCIQEQDVEFTTFHVRRTALNVGDTAVFLTDNEEEVLTLAGSGTPLRNCHIRVCDDFDQQLPEATVGHIQISGPNVTAGYYNNPEATERLFTPDGWARTGDLGFVSRDRLAVTGRTKDIIFINGANYFPHDIERIAENCSDLKIKRMVACGVYNQNTGTEEAALFVLYRDKLEHFMPAADQIRRELSRQMGLQVSIILPVSKIHQTTSGKLQRYKYAAQYKEGLYSDLETKLKRLEQNQQITARVHKKEPEGEIERALYQIWSELLGIQNFDSEDSFFEIGGTSMLVMQMSERIEELYPGIISPTDIFGSPSINRLSLLIAKNSGLAKEPIVLQKVELPITYFNAEAEGAGNYYQLILSGSDRNRLRSYCGKLDVPEISVYLALFAYCLYAHSTESTITVYTMIDSPGWLIPFIAAIDSIDSIGQLVQLAGIKEKPGAAIVHHIGDLAKNAAGYTAGQACCYLGYRTWMQKERGLEFDLMLEIEDFTDTTVLLFRYNASRMNSPLMREVFQGFADSMEVLISAEEVAFGLAPQ
jgi:fatty-acyl-CoA synthase